MRAGICGFCLLLYLYRQKQGKHQVVQNKHLIHKQMTIRSTRPSPDIPLQVEASEPLSAASVIPFSWVPHTVVQTEQEASIFSTKNFLKNLIISLTVFIQTQ